MVAASPLEFACLVCGRHFHIERAAAFRSQGDALWDVLLWSASQGTWSDKQTILAKTEFLQDITPSSKTGVQGYVGAARRLVPGLYQA